MYADHFRLGQYIRFETEVVSVEPQLDGGGRWSVTTRKTKSSNDAVTEVFDAVMVCSGIQSNKNMPNFEGQDEFKGELIHSVNYRQARLLQSVQKFLSLSTASMLFICSSLRLSVRPSVTEIRTKERDFLKI